MKISIINYPGSAFLDEFKALLMANFDVDVVIQFHNEPAFESPDIVIIPGGTSFGDYLRPGAFARTSPLSRMIRTHLQKGLRVLGIGNGFQILTELGILPGKFYLNRSTPLISDFVFLKQTAPSSFFVGPNETGEIYRLPLACRYGRYVVDKRELELIRDQNRIAFHYCKADGDLNTLDAFNGCTESIAGVYDDTHTALGIMGHPERALHPIMNGCDGIKFFSRLLGM